MDFVGLFSVNFPWVMFFSANQCFYMFLYFTFEMLFDHFGARLIAARALASYLIFDPWVRWEKGQVGI